MNYTVFAYSIYLPLTVALTIWVARTLHTNGKVFLVDIFHGQNELAIAVNKLLQVGFYLISLGFAIIKLKINKKFEYDEKLGVNVLDDIVDVQGMIETLSYKIGGFILILGLMLFINFFILLLIRGGAKSNNSNNYRVPSDVLVKGV